MQLPAGAGPRACRRVLRSAGASGLVTLALLALGCDGAARWQAARDREVEAATRAIANAADDAARGRGHSERGHAYSEKARYGRVTKTLPAAESERLFDQALADHDRAVSLVPTDAAVHLARGRAYYDRQALEPVEAAARKQRAAARADFTRALERDGRNALALDLRGLVNVSDGELDLAIADFTAEVEFDPKLGTLRLADTHCLRGSALQKAGLLQRAIADYERSIAFGAPQDGCECQPDSPLAWSYLELGRYDESWKVVHAAQLRGRFVDGELLERLKRVSGRDR